MATWMAAEGRSGLAKWTPMRLLTLFSLLLPLLLRPCSATWLTINAQIIAGTISLLNDHRISRGESALGFLNPRLYGRLLVGLNDIASGSNPGCNNNGFSVIIGWNLVRFHQTSFLSNFGLWLTFDSISLAIGHGPWDSQLRETA